MPKKYKFTDTEKWCPDCNQMQPLTEFGDHRYTASGKRTYCKYHENLRHVCRKRGIPYSPDFLLNEVCDICKVRPATCIDHDHATGKVRGHLCQPCNVGLGHFKDSPALLRTAAAYLERPSSTV